MTYFFLLFVAVAACFLFMGIKVITSKRPLFVPARYVFAFIVIAHTPQFIYILEQFGNSITDIALFPDQKQLGI